MAANGCQWGPLAAIACVSEHKMDSAAVTTRFMGEADGLPHSHCRDVDRGVRDVPHEFGELEAPLLG